MATSGRRQTNQSVAWIRDMYRAKQLDLDPPYQRRSVWNREYKQFFIDSILKNYPVPPIFVNLEIRDDGATIYHVIDGKQRLLSILEFLDDEFPTSTKPYSSLEHAGKYFSQLEQAVQRQIYGYFLQFELFVALARTDTDAIYDRFNRNVMRLNRQELRHARFGGLFITEMESLADHPGWQALRIFSKADSRRMADVEFVSELFLLTMHGIEEGSDDKLDDYYAQYDVGIEDFEDHQATFFTVMSMAEKLQELIRATRFRNRADFYSLWSALLEYVGNPESIDYKQTSEKLYEFAVKVDEVPQEKDPAVSGDTAVNYSQAVRAGTTKQTNREKRKEILLTFMVLK